MKIEYNIKICRDEKLLNNKDFIKIIEVKFV